MHRDEPHLHVRQPCVVGRSTGARRCWPRSTRAAGISSRLSKHAATDGIRAYRGPQDLTCAAGNGSSSLVRAALGSIGSTSS
jgi:hypothetical protein